MGNSIQINGDGAIMPFSTYNVSVRAVNEVGPGPFSNEVSVQTDTDGKCYTIFCLYYSIQTTTAIPT